MSDRVEEADLDTYVRKFLIPKLDRLADMAPDTRRQDGYVQARLARAKRSPVPIRCQRCGDLIRNHLGLTCSG